MKPSQELLDSLHDSAQICLTTHLDLTDPDIQDYKDVDLTTAIRTLRVCIKRMKDFEILK